METTSINVVFKISLHYCALEVNLYYNMSILCFCVCLTLYSRGSQKVGRDPNVGREEVSVGRERI